MKLVDSSVWIDHLNNRQSSAMLALRALIPYGDIGLCDLILMEVLQGIGHQRKRDLALQALQTFPVYETGGVTLAIRSADNYRFLRSHGFTVRTSVDCLIATFCIENGFELLHSDRDYAPFEEHLGLKAAAV